MTEDRATNIDRPVLAQRAFAAFVGFIYATTIALVIRTAYTISYFDSIVPVVLTLLILAFFAYDWMVRFLGPLQMSGQMTKSATPFLLKLFLEITIVYFLLLVSLKLVEIYAIVSWESRWTLLEKTPSHALCYSMAAFAVFSGLWNTVMITISVQVNKEQIRSLFKGHLDDKIVELFPFIKSWQGDLRKIKDTIHIKVIHGTTKFVETAPTDPNLSESVPEYLKRMRTIRRDLGLRLLLKCMVMRPHHLLLPYLFVFHVVALNFVLGGFIVLSSYSLAGKSLFAKQPFFHVVSPVLLLVGTFLSLLFLVIHFKSGKCETSFERLGCACLAITILFFYSVFPVIILILLVVLQQIAANFVMTRFFEPSRQTGRNNGAHLEGSN